MLYKILGLVRYMQSAEVDLSLDMSVDSVDETLEGRRPRRKIKPPQRYGRYVQEYEEEDLKEETGREFPCFRAQNSFIGPDWSSGQKLWCTGPSCSKLTMSLINVTLKLRSLKYRIYANIFAEKM